MKTNIPETCDTCDKNYVEKQAGRKCPFAKAGVTFPCSNYTRASDETLKQDAESALEELANLDERHRERVGYGPASSTLRDLMACDIVHWLNNYDARATFGLDGEPDTEERLLGFLDVKPLCNADRLAAVLFSSAMRGNVNAWNEVSKLLDRLDKREK